jgi:hypothetical protein
MTTLSLLPILFHSIKLFDEKKASKICLKVVLNLKLLFITL